MRANLAEITLYNGTDPILDVEVAIVTAPLPVAGMAGARRIGEKWTLIGRGQAFFLEVGDVEGSITHSSVYLEYDPFGHFGFGIGYDWFDVDVDVSDSQWYGHANIRFNGPMVFLKGSF